MAKRKRKPCEVCKFPAMEGSCPHCDRYFCKTHFGPLLLCAECSDDIEREAQVPVSEEKKARIDAEIAEKNRAPWTVLTELMDEVETKLDDTVTRLVTGGFSSVDEMLEVIDALKVMADDWRAIRKTRAVVGRWRKL